MIGVDLVYIPGFEEQLNMPGSQFAQAVLPYFNRVWAGWLVRF